MGSRLKLGLVTSLIHLASLPLSADLVVQNYFLDSSVFTAGLDPDHSQTVNNNNPVPTSFSQFAHVDPSFCSTGYQMDWTGDSAQFDITSSHRLQGYQGSVSSGGRWVVRPAVDSLVTFNGFFNYNHPASSSLWGRAIIDVNLKVEGTANFLFGDQASDGSVTLGPPSGTLNVGGSYLLQAGTLYRVGFSFGTSNFQQPPPEATWLGNGEVHITINPVPEPATAALVSLAIIPLLCRRFKH